MAKPYEVMSKSELEASATALLKDSGFDWAGRKIPKSDKDKKRRYDQDKFDDSLVFNMHEFIARKQNERRQAA